MKPSAVKLHRDTNEPVRTKTRYFHAHNGGILLPNDMKRAQVIRINIITKLHCNLLVVSLLSKSYYISY